MGVILVATLSVHQGSRIQVVYAVDHACGRTIEQRYRTRVIRIPREQANERLATVKRNRCAPDCERGRRCESGLERDPDDVRERDRRAPMVVCSRGNRRCNTAT